MLCGFWHLIKYDTLPVPSADQLVWTQPNALASRRPSHRILYPLCRQIKWDCVFFFLFFPRENMDPSVHKVVKKLRHVPSWGRGEPEGQTFPPISWTPDSVSCCSSKAKRCSKWLVAVAAAALSSAAKQQSCWITFSPPALTCGVDSAKNSNNLIFSTWWILFSAVTGVTPSPC